SHELSEVEKICDRVAIINRGKIERQGKLAELLSGGTIVVEAEEVPSDFAASVKKKIGDEKVSYQHDRLIVTMEETDDINAMVDGLRSAKGKIVSIVPRRRLLEDLFV